MKNQVTFLSPWWFLEVYKYDWYIVMSYLVRGKDFLEERQKWLDKFNVELIKNNYVDI